MFSSTLLLALLTAFLHSFSVILNVFQCSANLVPIYVLNCLCFMFMSLFTVLVIHWGLLFVLRGTLGINLAIPAFIVSLRKVYAYSVDRRPSSAVHFTFFFKLYNPSLSPLFQSRINSLDLLNQEQNTVSIKIIE